MLDWITRDEQGAHAADNPKVQEPPETPAPVFAIRAFKSALFGTPGAEDEERDRASQLKQPDHQRRKSDSAKPPPSGNTRDEKAEDGDATANLASSPTKSILVTPGTMSSRRKTVSFGESVVDNERKRDGLSNKVVKTPPSAPGNISAQWLSGSSDENNKPRSKLTQTLMNARDNASKNVESAKSTPDSPSGTKPVTFSRSKEVPNTEDITINLDEPRSESGKYWKTEFDNYRVRTNREIKKLIHYRSIAKSYARKKDSEALRLADKLREEEEKVAEMERRVSRLASTMAGEGSKADKEQLVRDLTKQTALALQFKQQVTSLRKLLERHDVVTGDTSNITRQTKEESPSENAPDELRKMQQQPKQANAKTEEMKHQKSELGTLQSLAQSSEKKAYELEKENDTLKQTLARVKQEMSRYEDRRKDKEAKLKQRESKLEARIQEYRDRLKTSSQEHRQSEEMLRNTFDEERRRLQSQIELLKSRIIPSDHAHPLPSHERHSFSPRKGYTGVEAYDFAGQNLLEAAEDVTGDFDAPPSPSPRSKARESRFSRNTTGGALDMRRAARNTTAEDDEVTHYLNEVLPKPQDGFHRVEQDPIPPSSPPDLSTLKSLSRIQSTKHHPVGDRQRIYRSLHARGAGAEPGHGPTQRQRSHIKSTLDTISGLPSSRTGTYGGHTIAAGERAGKRRGLADVQGEFLSPERVAAAKSRLKQKHDSRKSNALGKENVRAAV